MTNTYRYIELKTEPPLARLQIRRPPLNILDLATLQEMDDALSKIEASEELALVLLTGEGERAFSGGVDIKDHVPERVAGMLRSFHGVCRRLYQMDRVSLAAVKGYALGGGTELVACCDLVVAAETAILGLPEIDLACFPPLAAALFPVTLGARRTAEMIFLGRPFGAREALEAGLVNRVVSLPELDAVVEEIVAALKEKSPVALRLAKKALRAGRPAALSALGDIEKIYLEELTRTSDMEEGIAAYLGKRKPSWKGR